MGKKTSTQLKAVLLEEETQLSLAELCRASQLSAETILQLVEQGVIEPIGREQSQWRFGGVSLRRVRCVYRLQHDLGVNVAGAALALELLEELDNLRARLGRFESFE